MLGENDLRLPDFIIVGAMKAGTSSLAYYLDQHMSVRMPDRELHFFDRHFGRGLGWYARELCNRIQTEISPDVLLGEKTPTYSYDPRCARLIHDHIPNVKLIWIFRNPADRAFSNYLHYYRTGRELLSFREAVTRELGNGQPNRFRRYLARSHYICQVRRYLRFFPKKQMHFLVLEQLIERTSEEFSRLAKFLGVPDFPEMLPKPRNVTRKLPRFPHLIHLAAKWFGVESRAYAFASGISRRWQITRPAFPENMRPSLDRHFEPYNRALADLTGLEVRDWW